MRVSRAALAAAFAAAGILFSPIALPALGAPSVPTPLVIGVDNNTPNPCASAPAGTYPPACHNFGYNSYYPTSGVHIHSGDVVKFQTIPTIGDGGFHTVSFPKTNQSIAAYRASKPFGISDSEPGEVGQVQGNPAISNPDDPSCGSSAVSPCAYDGTSEVNSGILPLRPAGPFFYIAIRPANFNGQNQVTVRYICLIHRDMEAVLSVSAATTSTQAELDAASLTRYNQDTADALSAETGALAGSKVANADGTTTWNITAGLNGTGNPGIQVLEDLPPVVNIKAGDTVHFNSPSTDEIHTVTFPDGSGSASADFHAIVCEGTGGDTPAATTGPPCTPISGTEEHILPQPVGPTAINSPTDVASSGILAAGPPFPSSYGFSFPNKGGGKFTYQCKVHDHMNGVVLAAATVALPASGHPVAPVEPTGRGLVAGLGLALLAGLVLAATARRALSRG